MSEILTAWGLLIGTQAGGPDGVTTETVLAGQIQSMWDFVIKGGPMMIPIVACSLIALAVIIERLVSLRRRHVIPKGFLSGLQAVLDEDGDNREAAIEYCRSNGSPVARIFTAGIKRLAEPVELLEKHIQEAGQREVLKLRRYLRLLSVIASISPLMGLLGTIFGMINAFQTVAMSGEALGKAELLASGIYMAMITTAAGLLVAIPALIGYHWIAARIEQLVAEMDQMTCEFVEAYAIADPSQERGQARFRALRDTKGEADGDADEPETSLASA